MNPCLIDRLNGTMAPRSYWDLGLLGQSLGSDLVAHAPHYIAARTNEHDTQLLAKVSECGVLGYKAPAYPYRFRTRLLESALDPAIVDVTALRLLRERIDNLCGTKTHCFVCLTHEHATPIRLGEERDGAQRCAVFLIEIADRVDETHGGFAAIHNGYALKFMFHKSSDPAIGTISDASCRDRFQ